MILLNETSHLPETQFPFTSFLGWSSCITAIVNYGQTNLWSFSSGLMLQRQNRNEFTHKVAGICYSKRPPEKYSRGTYHCNKSPLHFTVGPYCYFVPAAWSQSHTGKGEVDAANSSITKTADKGINDWEFDVKQIHVRDQQSFWLLWQALSYIT